MNRRVEFIESYIKQDGDADYVWNDNHGVLVRCKDCKHYDSNATRTPACTNKGLGLVVCGRSDYCSYGEAGEENE